MAEMTERTTPPKPVTSGTHKAPHSMSEFELAGHALAHGPVKGVSAKAGQANKPLRQMHVRELHDGSYHVARHHAEGHITEHGAPTLDHVHDHMEEHFGENEAEENKAEEKAETTAEEKREHETGEEAPGE